MIFWLDYGCMIAKKYFFANIGGFLIFIEEHGKLFSVILQ